nr:hypothetical protein [Tanacetum cinerariifolium]
ITSQVVTAKEASTHDNGVEDSKLGLGPFKGFRKPPRVKPPIAGGKKCVDYKSYCCEQYLGRCTKCCYK